MRTLIFDTETTGLVFNRITDIKRQESITELFAIMVDLNTGEVSGCIDSLVKPCKEISKEIVAKIGITNEMVKGAPPFAELYPAFQKMLEEAEAVMGHNLSFDMDMVGIEVQRMLSPSLRWQDHEPPWPRRKICTVEQTIHLKGHRLKLNDLHELLFGQKFSEAHRAGPDTLALVRCAVELRKRALI